MIRALVMLLLALPLAGCLSDDALKTAETVLTLQSGTMSELRNMRGQGPFRTYDVAPDVMLGVVEEAARMARIRGDEPVRAIFVSERKGEVVAKEREGEAAKDDGYEAAFRTAMYAVVHEVPDQPGRSRVEIHEMTRGPFHTGVVRWVRDMPGWIDAVLAERARAEAEPVKPIP